MPGQQDHRQIRVDGVQVAEELQPIHPGHPHIGQNDARIIARHPFQGIGGKAEILDLQTRHFQGLHLGCAQILVIVHQPDQSRHAAFLSVR